MKILIFNTLYYPNIVGGAEKSVQLLAELLLEKGYEPIVISTDTKDHIDIINGVKVYYLSYRNLYWGIKSSSKSKFLKPFWHTLDIYNPLIKRKISEIIKEERPSVIHTNNLAGFSVAPWICANEEKIPVVHTLRDYYLICVKSTAFKNGMNCEQRCLTCRTYTEYKRLLTKKGYVQHLVGNSQFIIDRHKQLGYFRDTKSTRIFNGAVLDVGVRDDKYFGSEKKGKLKFLYMGRIEETKGVNLLLNVFNGLNQVKLYLAGRIHDSTIAKNIEANHYSSNINFLGFVNPKEIIPKVDIVIVPSIWHEPLPRAVLEAYTYDKPVLGSNRGGIPESIKDGVTGFLFDPNNEEELKNIIFRLLDQPEQLSTIVDNIHNHILEYDINTTVDEYMKVYYRLRHEN
jgi:glycosyltransferase involved in cell wall biosynthesis